MQLLLLLYFSEREKFKDEKKKSIIKIEIEKKFDDQKLEKERNRERRKNECRRKSML